MIEGSNRPAPQGGVAEESTMSVDEFIAFGLEPGQRALLWDFEQKKYVSVSKPGNYRSLLGSLMAAAAAVVHGFVVIYMIGGLNS